MLRVFMFSLLFVGILACKTDSGNSTANAIADPNQLKPLPKDIKENIVNNCDYIDYTFYDLNFSMSQSDPAAIKANVSLLSDKVQGTIPPECKPIGRKYYHVNGEIVMEAELYYGQGCLFYIYKDGNTTLYGNQLSEGAVTFYTKIFTQASGQK